MKRHRNSSGIWLPQALLLLAVVFLPVHLGFALGLGFCALASFAGNRIIDSRASDTPQIAAHASWEGVDWSGTLRTDGESKHLSGRKWRALLTDEDLWLCPGIAGFDFSKMRYTGSDDFLRIPRLDIVEVRLQNGGIHVKFLSDKGRVQEVSLMHVPRALALARALGHESRLHAGP